MLNFKVKSFKEARPQSRHKTTHCIRYGVLTLGCSWPSLAVLGLSIPSPPFSSFLRCIMTSQTAAPGLASLFLVPLCACWWLGLVATPLEYGRCYEYSPVANGACMHYAKAKKAMGDTPRSLALPTSTSP